MKIEDVIEHYDPIPETGCYIWAGGWITEGYGTIRIDGKQVRVHRAVYEYFNGKIPDGMIIRHKCDCPSCINPAHLEIGTHKDNMKDMVSRNRQTRGESQHLSKLTKKEVLEIRASNLSQRKLAKIYNVHQTLISCVKLRKVWKHI